jgi:hypothetical protein
MGAKVRYVYNASPDRSWLVRCSERGDIDSRIQNQKTETGEQADDNSTAVNKNQHVAVQYQSRITPPGLAS